MTEVEKLRALLAEARMYLTMNGGSADDRIVRRIDAALAESPSGDMGPDVVKQRQTFIRGAEAMREAAMGAAWHSAAMGLYKKIRDLPIPEDK